MPTFQVKREVMVTFEDVVVMVFIEDQITIKGDNLFSDFVLGDLTNPLCSIDALFTAIYGFFDHRVVGHTGEKQRFHAS